MLVFSNSATSLDGRLSTTRNDHVSLGTPEDRRWMSVLRAKADAVLVGGRTFRNWALPLIEDPRVAASQRHRPMVNAVLTRTGYGPRRGAFFQHPGTRVVFFGAPEADLSGFPDGVDIHRLGPDSTVENVLDRLEDEYGVDSLLVEGGGDLIFQLLEANRLHEINVTICPSLIGGLGATSLVDGAGFLSDDIRRLKLLTSRILGDEIYLRYRVLPHEDPGA